MSNYLDSYRISLDYFKSLIILIDISHLLLHDISVSRNYPVCHVLFPFHESISSCWMSLCHHSIIRC